jgi:hypothetical protein
MAGTSFNQRGNPIVKRLGVWGCKETQARRRLHKHALGKKVINYYMCYVHISLYVSQFLRQLNETDAVFVFMISHI